MSLSVELKLLALTIVLCVAVTSGDLIAQSNKKGNRILNDLSQNTLLKVEQTGILSDEIKLDFYRSITEEGISRINLEGTSVKVKSGNKVFIRVSTAKMTILKEGTAK